MPDAEALVPSVSLHELGDGDNSPGQLILQSAVVWMCGVPAGCQEQRELMAILAAYGGSRYPDLCAPITHIVVSGGRRGWSAWLGCMAGLHGWAA